MPRVGFFIAEGLVATIEEPPSVTVTSLAPPKATPSLSKRVKMMLLAAGGISLIMLLYPVNTLFNSAKTNLPDVHLYKLGNIDLCPVYTVFESSREVATAKLEKAQKMADLHLKCLAGALFIFQPDDLYVYGEKGRVFLSRCTFNNVEKTKFAGCKDLYIHEY